MTNHTKQNLTGYCKFQNTCNKTDVVEICSNLWDCRINNCIKRHPRIWKTFRKRGYCRHQRGYRISRKTALSNCEKTLYKVDKNRFETLGSIQTSEFIKDTEKDKIVDSNTIEADTHKIAILVW